MIQLNLESLSTGLYFLKSNMDGKVSVKKNYREVIRLDLMASSRS